MFMKVNRILFSILVTTLAACGGGSGGSSSQIEGSWSGDLFQGMILCSDGTGFGAGGGSVVKHATLEISGTDEIGSIVQVMDEECLLEGVRDADGFRARPVSGCHAALSSIRFNLYENNSAGVSYHYDINKSEPGPTGIRCTTSPSGLLSR